MTTELNIKKDWKIIETKLDKTFYVGKKVLELKIGEDNLKFVFHLFKGRVVYLLYVNNKINTIPSNDTDKKYMNEITKKIFPSSVREKILKKLIREKGKIKGKEEFEKSRYNNEIKRYEFIFRSKRSIKKMLERQTEKIMLLEGE